MDVSAKGKVAGGGTCYLLDHTKIKAGDVLLSTTDAGLSSIIRGVTGSDFSHAAIFIQNGGTVIEAVAPNVKLSSVVDLAIRDRKSVKVLRWAGQDPAVGQAVARYARAHVFKGYSRKGAVLTQVPGALGSADGHELFCSQLIAASYLSCDLALTDKDPDKTTPEDIARSPRMVDITDEVLIEVDSERLLVERYMEHGKEDDLGTEFHSMIAGIVNRTVRACPFVKRLQLTSLEQVIAALVWHERLMSAEEAMSLAQAFTSAVGDRLERYIERSLELHSSSFHQHEVYKKVLASGFIEEHKLRHQLVWLQTMSEQSRQSLDMRNRDIAARAALLEQATPGIANLSVVKTIEHFYAEVQAIEQACFDSGLLAIEVLRAHLDQPAP